MLIFLHFRKWMVENWHLETGLEFLTSKYTSTSTSFFPFRTSNYTKKLISIPVKFRYEAGKYIFFNGNLYLDIDVSKNGPQSMSGIGTGIGMGGQYFLGSRFGIYLNPQFDLRNLATFSGNHYKFANTRVAIGMMYKVK